MIRKRIFDTTKGLVEIYGSERVIEPPTSENALTGICLGLCERGFSVCLTHQRFDFALLSFDQIINSIAKWKFMYGKDNYPISMVIRLIVGRGWGQGPTHSQSYHSFLASIPGLRVIYPYNPETFYGALKSGMSGSDPTIIIEHRWLHNVKTEKEAKEFDINSAITRKPTKLRKGDDITIFGYGYIIPEILKVIPFIQKYGVDIELYVMTNLSDVDSGPIKESAKKTKNVILLEPYYKESSLMATVASAILSCNETRKAIESIDILSLPFESESTSYFQTINRYLNGNKLITKINNMIGTNIPAISENAYHDVPGEWFKGPF